MMHLNSDWLKQHSSTGICPNDVILFISCKFIESICNDRTLLSFFTDLLDTSLHLNFLSGP